jgi:hypothetical protein
MEPNPLTQPARALATGQKLTDTAIISPSIVLMDVTQSMEVLLSRQTLIEPNAVHLAGVRLVELPLGWHLRMIKFLSCFCKIRLPDEREFAAVEILKQPIPGDVVVLPARTIGHVSDLSQLLTITAAEYLNLSTMNGRSLYRWIEKQFGVDARSVAPNPQPQLRHRGRAA